MIRLIFRFAVIAALAAGFAWLADHPGSVTIVWKGKEIRTSLAAAVGLAAGAMIILLFLWNLLRRLWRSPRSMGDYLRYRKNRKGYESLSRGIIAAGAGDASSAAKHAAYAGNALADEPLVNVLAAQAAQLKGDRTGVKRIFEAMTKSPDTEVLGLRGLFAEARQAGDIPAARGYAERALALNPRLAWASGAILHLQSMARDWPGAAATLAQQIKSGTATGEEANRKHAAMLAADALGAEDTDPAKALDRAVKAHKLDPALVPASLVAARVHIAQGSPRKAQRVLRETWALSPHPDLAAVLARLKPGDGPEARFERVRDLVQESDGGIEGAVALARAAVPAQRWDVARKALEPYMADRPQARICALMADIEEASGDKGRAREWLARAISAPRDPIWVSDGVASPRWTPVSPVSGEIVPCLWKQPFEMLPEEHTSVAAVPAVTVPGTASTKPITTPVRPIALTRPPDDPGLPDGDGTPESAARRSLATDD
ncbi:heme biosynthesis protein HemY [Aestuariivirga sp.]|uniref:heme biosynthesis protein HemY n=1 Tax=Aestuariivirga sp. TaxID=2650926 RepID=UPI0039E4E5D3